MGVLLLRVMKVGVSLDLIEFKLMTHDSSARS